MKTTQLIKILPDEDKREFIKDYYNQVKEGLKDSNTTAWKFCFYSVVIVLLYYAFDAELIKKISLGRISVEDLRLVQIATPLLFSFCYYIMALNLARYNELRVQYDILLFKYTGDSLLSDKNRYRHFSALPLNQLDVLLDYFFEKNNIKKNIIGVVSLVPFTFVFCSALYFIYITTMDLPFASVPIVSYSVAFIAAYFIIISLKITGTSNKRVVKGREILKEFIEKESN
jgi:hypothetical protein